jgi:hypothetical protein
MWWGRRWRQSYSGVFFFSFCGLRGEGEEKREKASIGE